MRAHDRWPEVKALFEQAQAVDASSRDRWLRERCGADPVLLEEVRSLLAFDERPHRVFERAAPSLAALLDEDDEDALPQGTAVGPYRVERSLGRGGMGAVYLADRTDGEVSHRVAIKIIKRGMDTAEIVRRFRVERQTLATLNHPNIATLLDAGRTPEGVPYFVMEYVEGEPIVRYCAARGLSDAQRLRLMLRVFAAVQHAHQHLIVHRDLKPDNVLVRADGEPKLLDFGIAKLLEEEQAAATRTAVRPMTPRYASPEQVRGEAISTASDIYSLGVLLYEVLTGRLPYDGEGTSTADVERAICDREPVPLGSRRFPADLDAIVLMALRKEPERRYASVEQFAEDVRRFLSGLPVLAQRDSVRYRASKFVRRNGLAVAAAAIAALSLIGGAAAAAWQARVARREAAAAAENAARARVEAARAERVSSFLKSVLQLPDPSWYATGAGQPRDMTISTLLRAAAARVDADLQQHPDVAADIHHTLGNTYRALGMYDEAARHYDTSLTQRRQVFGDIHAKVAASLYMQHAIDFVMRRYDDATARLREAIRIARLAPPASDMPDLLPHMLTDLAGQLAVRRRFPEAAAASAEALTMFRQRYGNDHLTVAYAKRPLAAIRRSLGDLAAAEALLREAAATIQRLSPPDSQNVAPILEDLAVLAGDRGRHDEAMALLRDAYSRQEGAKGAGHPDLAHNLTLQARVETQARRFASAERLARAAVQSMERRYGEGSPPTLGSVQRLADVLLRAGKAREAEPHARRALNILVAQHRGKGCEVAYQRLSLASALAAQSRLREAEPLARESYFAIVSECAANGQFAHLRPEADDVLRTYFPDLLAAAR